VRAKGDVVAAKPGRLGLRDRLRVARRVGLIAAALAPGAPAQWLALRVWPAAARRLPTLLHRYICAVMGVRRDVRGVSRGAVLLVANHMSWLDIVVLSACRPTCFVGKSEIADWPLFGALARLQDTLFVDRARRIGAERDARDIARRLACGQSVTLFAEGTSSDGCGVLPFRSALFGVAREASVALQPVALAYLARNGERLDAQGRRDVAWWGDKALAPHLIEILALKSLDVRVEFGEPERPSPQENRKALARRFEQDVRRRVEAALA
jgi:1-acyl-sn-glycerol-3-phosphate acyltransferase